MKKRFLPKLSYANVVASLALFLALGGAAVAASRLPANSVGPRQLRPAAVRAIAIARNAVTARKLAPRSVVVGKLGPLAVTPNNLANGSVTTQKIANEAVTTSRLGKGSVTLAKLGSDVAPLLGTLKTGQTLRGTFNVGGEAKVARDGLSFQFPLVNPPAAAPANILGESEKTTACPGLAGGNKQTPEAAAGQLCVYIKAANGTKPELGFDEGSVNRLGFGLFAKFETASANNQIQGFWAVTAP